MALGTNPACYSPGIEPIVDRNLARSRTEIAIILGGCMLGQWLLVQIPLWALSVGYGVRLRHWTDPAVTDTVV